jgi:hypothetical protein
LDNPSSITVLFVQLHRNESSAIQGHLEVSGLTCSADLECPLWVKSGHLSLPMSCPLYPRKRALDGTAGCQQICQPSCFGRRYPLAPPTLRHRANRKFWRDSLSRGLIATYWPGVSPCEPIDEFVDWHKRHLSRPRRSWLLENFERSLAI